MFGRSAVLLGVAATALLSVRWSGASEPSLWPISARAGAEILFVEALFLVAFLVFVWFRSMNPGSLAPVSRRRKTDGVRLLQRHHPEHPFPAVRPLVRGRLHQLLLLRLGDLASVVRLTGIVPAVAFNLAVPTVFGLAILNSWAFVSSAVSFLSAICACGRSGIRSDWACSVRSSCASSAISIWRAASVVGEYGLSAGFRVVALLGLGSVGDIIRGDLARGGRLAHAVPPDAYWTPTRVIGGTVNEFPYFSMLFADLHPHMMAIPFSLLAMVIALGIVASHVWPEDQPRR